MATSKCRSPKAVLVAAKTALPAVASGPRGPRLGADPGRIRTCAENYERRSVHQIQTRESGPGGLLAGAARTYFGWPCVTYGAALVGAGIILGTEQRLLGNSEQRR